MTLKLIWPCRAFVSAATKLSHDAVMSAFRAGAPLCFLDSLCNRIKKSGDKAPPPRLRRSNQQNSLARLHKFPGDLYISLGKICISSGDLYISLPEIHKSKGKTHIFLEKIHKPKRDSYSFWLSFLAKRRTRRTSRRDALGIDADFRAVGRD